MPIQLLKAASCRSDCFGFLYFFVSSVPVVTSFYFISSTILCGFKLFLHVHVRLSLFLDSSSNFSSYRIIHPSVFFGSSLSFFPWFLICYNFHYSLINLCSYINLIIFVTFVGFSNQSFLTVVITLICRKLIWAH